MIFDQNYGWCFQKRDSDHIQGLGKHWEGFWHVPWDCPLINEEIYSHVVNISSWMEIWGSQRCAMFDNYLQIRVDSWPEYWQYFDVNTSWSTCSQWRLWWGVLGSKKTGFVPWWGPAFLIEKIHQHQMISPTSYKADRKNQNNLLFHLIKSKIIQARIWIVQWQICSRRIHIH